MNHQVILNSSEDVLEPIQFDDPTRFVEDLRLAGVELSVVEEKLGFRLCDADGVVPRYAWAYVELLLALKDGRHPW